MKLFSVLALLGCTSFAAAQDLKGLPECAVKCVEDSDAIPADCGDNKECICASDSFLNTVSCCSAFDCGLGELQGTVTFIVDFCKGAQFANIQLPTCSGLSPTASSGLLPSNTAAGAATDDPTSGSDSDSPGGLLTSSKIAIGLAVPLGVLLIAGAFLALFLWRRRKRRPVTEKAQFQPPHAPGFGPEDALVRGPAPVNPIGGKSELAGSRVNAYGPRQELDATGHPARVQMAVAELPDSMPQKHG